MFTGIIETMGRIVRRTPDGGNVHLEIEADIAPELRVDQSVAHDGVCLTVVAVDGDRYTVTAIQETLEKSAIGSRADGDHVNLERCMPAGGRFDGHIVQGHVDQVGRCIHRTETDGSWRFRFAFTPGEHALVVEKGSITVNGVSLTVFNVGPNHFEVAVIPYTFQHTNLRDVDEGDAVNLEFDILGKYVARMLADR